MRRSTTPAWRFPRALTAPLGVLLLISALAACGVQTTAKTQPTATPTALPEAPITPPAKGWNQLTSPSVAPEGQFSAITARTASDAWAVGRFEGTDGRQQTLIAHWDGAKWAQVASPSPGKQDNALVAVAAVRANDAWAVGSQISGNSDPQPLALHWDGAKWSATSIPPQNTGITTLSGVAALSPSNAWAVGETSTPGSGTQAADQQPLILHWNGSAWSAVSSPRRPAGFNSLNAIAALAANNIWAVGTTAIAEGGNTNLIEHWNGSAWSVVPAPTGDGNGQQSLTGIAAISAGDIWAVGDGPLSAGQSCGMAAGATALHWNGAKWSASTLAVPTGQDSGGISLASVAAAASNNVWAVGSTGTGATPIIERWNGSAWSIVPGASLTTTHGLEGVAALPMGTVWAVGQSLLSNGSGPTIIEQWSGSQWAQVASPSPGTIANELHAVAAASSNAAWAVGSSAAGTLAERWDGTHWSVAPTPSLAPNASQLNGVATTSASDAWAVGSQTSTANNQYETFALIEHWNGSAWSVVPTPTTGVASSPLNAVAALSAKDAWAVGDSNVIQHWDGTKWSVSPTPNLTGDLAYGSDLLGVSARAANDVWAVGGNTPHGCGGVTPVLVEHWNGSKWTVMPLGIQGVLYSVSADAANDAWAVGLEIVLHWNGTSWAQVKLPSSGAFANAALYSVAARTANDVWAVGTGGTQGNQMLIAHWDGTTWTATSVKNPGLGTNMLASVTTVSPTEAWAVGYFCQLAYGEARQALIMRYGG